MDERLFTRLPALLGEQAVVLACVLDTRGATPRQGGAKMLITRQHSEFSVGGGEAESRVITAARQLLDAPQSSAELLIDLSGQPGAAGVCGGSMRIALRRWQGELDGQRAEQLRDRLAAGEAVQLCADEVGTTNAGMQLRPDPRLLIVGAGHCGHALYQLAQLLEYQLWVFDQRAELVSAQRFPIAQRLCGDFAQLRQAFASPRELQVVLVSRDFPSDVGALQVLLATAPAPAFIGMMGSHRRIRQVQAALPQHADALARLQAPVGLEIAAQTPHEIAVSILAQLIGFRNRA